MRRRHTLVAAVVAALALVAAGCGSDDSSSSSDATPTEEWADNLCSAITTWTGSLESSVNSLKDGGLSQDALQGVVDDTKSATDTFVDDLKSLGKPDTEAGEQAQQAVTTLVDELQTGVDQIESAVSDVSGVSGVVQAIATVSTTLVNMGNDFSSTFSELQSLDAKGEIESAFQSSSSCKELTSSGS